ncbi:hypothetical protein IWZ03DRAFT_118800 [Phyllosticta citriasiana]|uniref:Secreted protein n=1 Tax=Phyllosticta citriasiana TaxID=595635 RepID=A0ABR1KX35_9PEZI
MFPLLSSLCLSFRHRVWLAFGICRRRHDVLRACSSCERVAMEPLFSLGPVRVVCCQTFSVSCAFGKSRTEAPWSSSKVAHEISYWIGIVFQEGNLSRFLPERQFFEGQNLHGFKLLVPLRNLL